MEFCMEAKALKPSLHREFSVLKQTQQVFFDDINYSCGVVSNNNDDFSVDDLLDFSNGDFEEDGSVDDKDSFSSRDPTVDVDVDVDVDIDVDVDDDNNSNSGSFSSEQSLVTNEFVEPVDDFAELEWVSQFVDDSSCSELSLLYPNSRSEPETKPGFNKTTTTITTATTTPCLPLRVPSKARTKRTRPTGRVWSFGSPLSSESTTISTSSSTTSSGLILTNSVQNIEWFFDEPVVKKPKKKPAVQGGGLFLRRCSHCQTQKTPQWRTGPHGPKTLCNACGVRFKSGRLFPEYRPACSPTFSVDVHSNSHRKVLEMRKKKESGEPEAELSQMVQSF